MIGKHKEAKTLLKKPKVKGVFYLLMYKKEFCELSKYLGIRGGCSTIAIQAFRSRSYFGGWKECGPRENPEILMNSLIVSCLRTN